MIKSGQALDEKELTDYCQDKLAAYKIPKFFRFVEELPKSAIGKLMRREVRRLELE